MCYTLKNIKSQPKNWRHEADKDDHNGKTA
jgi:hypothetical protein